MPGDFEIRLGMQSDWSALEQLYPKAFPEEDLLPLVRDLIKEGETGISLVAGKAPDIIGHAMFTRCGVSGCNVEAALLGPVAVTPAWQRQGLGSALIRFGLERLKYENVALVCVLGDPAYYTRLGFLPEPRVQPPFQLPEEWVEAWQSQCLREVANPIAGTLIVPPPWTRPELWGP